jgi:hypothetical protein
MSMKNSDDINGNQTRDIPACSAVPQPTALLRVSLKTEDLNTFVICDLFPAARSTIMPEKLHTRLSTALFIPSCPLNSNAREAAY